MTADPLPRIELAAIDPTDAPKTSQPLPHWLRLHWKTLGYYALFGVLFGMAMACKVSAYPLAVLLPMAAWLHYTRQTKEDRQNWTPILLRNIVLAAVIAFLVFRIFQPYAFTGPGFFGMKLNDNWVNNLKELSAQSTGDIDVPFALQWARRPISFAWTNMVEWGLGIPLGLLAWAGFLWMGWRMLKGDWQKHLLLWSWVAFVFISQSVNWVRAMRYQLPVYPALALIAAWGLFKLFETGSKVVWKITSFQVNWRKVLAIVLGIVVVASSALWAFAFTRIYTRPVTRVAASEWIYQNVAGALNLTIDTGSGSVQQPLAYSNGASFAYSQPLQLGFTLDEAAEITGIRLEHLENLQQDYPLISVVASVVPADVPSGTPTAMGFLQSNFQPSSDARGDAATITFEAPGQVSGGTVYTLRLDVAEPDKVARIYGSIEILYTINGQQRSKMLPQAAFQLTQGVDFSTSFFPVQPGLIKGVWLNRVVDTQLTPGQKQLVVTLLNNANPQEVIATGSVTNTFLPKSDVRGDKLWVAFDNPVALDQTQVYSLHLQMVKGSGALAVYNDVTAIESTWDDPLPLGMNGYNNFGYDDGIYGNVLNFEMYWDDTNSKLARMENILDQTDVIYITSNRQWGTIPRVPERYPLSTEYYRDLLGCPANDDLLKCYQNAQPGMYQGKLGFDLVQVFQSNPNLGSFQINDQSAEEAFTVYDHPKVLIFRKNASYNSQAVHSLLEKVDLTKAVHLTPRQAGSITGNLMLSNAALKVQQAGGTWTQLFDPKALMNENQTAAVVIWYLAVLLLGWMVYPMVRLALKSLPDRGYPVSRLVGLILLALIVWWAGFSGISFSRTTIGVVLLGLLAANLALAIWQRKELKAEIKNNLGLYLAIEALMLVFFAADLIIRYNNPDLWHPWRGGEKPMDLSYLTAVIKSTTFPPYDPWYSGGYINYYYFGYVITGTLVKFLGIIPDVAYNLILPTWFGMTALGAFSIGWNLFARQKKGDSEGQHRKIDWRAFGAGISASLLLLVLGNLGTLRMIWQGWQKLVAPNGVITDATTLEHISWAWQGLGKMLGGAKLPYAYGDWLWLPSRALPGDTITEFPFFTFTYADLHAHLIALPITLLVITWGISLLKGRWRWWEEGRAKGWIALAASLLLGSLAIGVLRPTNTWDYPTYLALSAVILSYVIFQYAHLPERWLSKWPEWLRKAVMAAAALAVLFAISSLLIAPFSATFDQAYGTVDAWKGDHSPFDSFLVHWGLFLFIVISWLVWETREWLANTPVSALKTIRAHSGALQTLAVLFGVVLLVLAFMGVQVGWITIPLGVWSLILILRPGQPDTKRLILFMIGTAMFLTTFVELFALQGDIGRMNTVFKFYYQAWTMLAISSAAALTWLFPAVTSKWRLGTSSVWQVVLAFLVFGAALYPLTATMDKIRDRFNDALPKTLDGTAFMKSSVYYDVQGTYELNQDYDGIQWMRQNVVGSPVLVEANTVEYRWGNRYTIYTGLPGVLGWNFHQRQQRGFLDYNGIASRLDEIPSFYLTTQVEDAVSFLRKYNVTYIILGQEERALYPGDGLNKFDQYDGIYWQKVFSEKETEIFQVIR
jgi:YYY domain-containing protein